MVGRLGQVVHGLGIRSGGSWSEEAGQVAHGPGGQVWGSSSS